MSGPVTLPDTAPAALAATPQMLAWREADHSRSAIWHSDNPARVPSRVQVVTRSDAALMDAVQAHRLASAGVGLLWRGDFHAAKQVLAGMGERMDAADERRRALAPADADADAATMAHAFAEHRKAQALRLRVLAQVLVELDGAHRLQLPRAPDVTLACSQAFGLPNGQPHVVPLRSLLGAIGAHEWRKRGVPIAALKGAHIHPHHGVFSPVRGEYIDLVAQAPLPPALAHCPLAFDIGTGSGVLSAVLAQRGVPRVVATDCAERALACASDNMARLGLTPQVALERANLFPQAAHGPAALVVCNPPWLPAAAHSPLEAAVYDPDSQMLQGFLAGLRQRLCEGGEGWLIMSNLAELLGLRAATDLPTWVAQAGLRVLGQHHTLPRHAKAQHSGDRLHAARAQEVTTLWRLGAQDH